MEDPNVPQKAETLYDETKHVAYKPDTTISRAATQSTMRKASIRFFLVAGLTLLELMLKHDSMSSNILNVLVILVFGTIGIFVFKMHRGAFLAALGLYGFSTLIILIAALSDDYGIFFYARTLAIRGYMLYQMYLNYGLLCDLHDLEEGHWD